MHCGRVLGSHEVLMKSVIMQSLKKLPRYDKFIEPFVMDFP